MTLTTLITLNAVLAAALVYGVVFLLTHGIRSDRRFHFHLARVHQVRSQADERLAA